MNYWITTHWPPSETDNPKNVGTGIWIPDGREDAGEDLRSGDLVLIYQTRTGRARKSYKSDGSFQVVKSTIGREGIITIAQVERPLRSDGKKTTAEYTNGTKIWWRWYAPLKIISGSGFVTRSVMNAILGYKANYNLRGFGDRKSGLRKISKEQYESLLNLYKKQDPLILPDPVKRKSNKHGNGGESDAHRNLKEYVASNPQSILKEKGLKTEKIEYPFPTGDRADIVLSDSYGRIIGLEVEVDINDGDIEGLLQAIKYRYMLELITRRALGDSRSFLVAYTISDEIKDLCDIYGIEFFEVERSAVEEWIL